MDLYPRTNIGNDVEKMIQSKHVSENDLRSFNFGSFQTSLMTSCVPPFKCGSLPKSCGSSSVRYNNEENLSQSAVEGTEAVVIKSDDQSSSDNLSSEERSSTQHCVTDTGEKISDGGQKEQLGLADNTLPVGFKTSSANSGVVITQPTSAEASSANDRSPFTDNRKQLEVDPSQNNISNTDHNSRNSNSNLDWNIQRAELTMPTSTEPRNQNTNSLSSEGNAEPSLQFSSPNSTLRRTNRRPKDSYPQGQNSDKRFHSSFRDNRESMGNTSERSEFQQSCFSDLTTEGLREGRRLHSASPSGVRKARKELKRSSKNTSSKEGSRIRGCSRYIDTQRLFTPEDLSKEHVQPNPPGFSSEIYQNFNAREADFVLHRPRRKPRKVPLPPSFMVTVGLKTDLHQVHDGLIEPLATEDEVALREGTKEFIENGMIEGTEITFHNSYDFSPCEAVNFALENSIDNFDRDEYVKFKKAKDSDTQVPNIPESSFLLQSLIIKPENKKGPLGTRKNTKENDNLLERMDNINQQGRLENNSNTVPKSLPRSPRSEKDNGNITSSYKHEETCLKDEKVHKICNITSSEAEKDGKFSKVGYGKQISSEKTVKERQSKTVEVLSGSRSFESATKRMNYDFPMSADESDQPFIAFSVFEEGLMQREKSKHITKTRSLEGHKIRSEFKSSTSEKHRHKKSTKLYKNIKYYKITNRSQTSFDSDSKASLEGEESLVKTPDSFMPKSYRRTSKAASSKRENPLMTYSTRRMPRTTKDILEEVQSNLRARLASLEDLDALVENMEGNGTPSSRKSLVPYKPLEDVGTSITPTSFTPPSSSSPSSKRDWFFCTGATRKESKRKHARTKKRGRRDVDDSASPATSKALYNKRPSPSSGGGCRSSSSSSSSSSSDESSFSQSSPKSSSMTSTSSSSSSTSSSDSTSSSIDSSDVEDSVI